MVASVRIRKINKSDIAHTIDLQNNIINELRGTLIDEYLEMLREFLSPEYEREALSQDNYIGLLAELESDVVGIIQGRIFSGGLAQITWFCVQHDQRRKGIGNKLLNVWCEVAKKRDVHKIFLNTCPELIAANELYRKLGFKEEGYFKNHAFHQDIKWFSKFV